MALHPAFRFIAAGVLFGSIPAHSQDQNAEQMKALVTGKTWAISFQGNLANPSTVTYWDFKADGKICARFIGAKEKDPCADDGTWQLKGDVLCWNLQKIGETHAFKSACVRARKIAEKRYDAIAQEGYKMATAHFYPLR